MARASVTVSETSLYPALKAFLEDQGYDVKGEVVHCDVVAQRGDEPPVVVELKLSLNLTVLLQAVDRLALSPTVYIAVPRQCSALKLRRRAILRLLRMLGLGLIVIDTRRRTGAVDVVLDPGSYQPRISTARQQRLLREFQRRVGDPEAGGTDRRRGLMTAYRQRSLAIAGYLRQSGVSRPADIAAALGEPEARDILYRNVYGWFERPERGVYQLTPAGEQALTDWQPATD
ncbi:MAG: hypothetical protein H6993_04095 [Pseudomonadales bacterium]|nr:hypothetical protein [Pseudomonadales bacterium]